MTIDRKIRFAKDVLHEAGAAINACADWLQPYAAGDEGSAKTKASVQPVYHRALSINRAIDAALILLDDGGDHEND